MIKNDKDYVELGKQLAALFEYGSPSRKAILWSSFLRGLAQGLGAVIGGTILVAFLIWILSLFNHIPLIGPAVDAITRSIHK
jgi:hypothetical protein